jgi:hypothetical protein
MAASFTIKDLLPVGDFLVNSFKSVRFELTSNITNGNPGIFPYVVKDQVGTIVAEGDFRPGTSSIGQVKYLFPSIFLISQGEKILTLEITDILDANNLITSSFTIPKESVYPPYTTPNVMNAYGYFDASVNKYRLDTSVTLPPQMFNQLFTATKLELFERSNPTVPIFTQEAPIPETIYIDQARHSSVYSVITAEYKDPSAGEPFINCNKIFSEMFIQSPVATMTDFNLFMDSKGLPVNQMPRPIGNIASDWYNTSCVPPLYSPPNRITASNTTNLIPDTNWTGQLFEGTVDKGVSVSSINLNNSDSNSSGYPAQANFEVNIDFNAMLTPQNRSGDRITYTPSTSPEGPTVVKTFPIVDVEAAEISQDRLKVITMPPIDFAKPTWKFKLAPDVDFIENSDDYVILSSGYMNSTQTIGEAIFVDGFEAEIVITSQNLSFDVPYSLEVGFSSNNYVWYTKDALIAKIGNGISSYNEPKIYPLIKTNMETAKITKLGSEALGQNLELSCLSEGFSYVNKGIQRYQWYKDGIPIPGKTGRVLTISNIQPSDAGSYTVKSSAYPLGLYGPDSMIDVMSDPFVIDPNANTVEVDLVCTPIPIVLGAEFTLTGTVVASKPENIRSIELWKDGAVIRAFDSTNLAPTWSKPTAELSDSGVYYLIVEYMDGTFRRSAITEPVTVYFEGDRPLEIITTITGPSVVDEGDIVQFQAISEVITPGVIPTFTIQWFKDGFPITDQNYPDLTIEGVTYPKDEGNYQAVTVASAHGYMPAISRSNIIHLKVLTNLDLVARVFPVSLNIKPGQLAQLRVEFISDQPAGQTWKWYVDGIHNPSLDNQMDISVPQAKEQVTYQVYAVPDPTLGLPIEVQSNIVTISVKDTPDPVQGDVYIHPLMPGRRGGFLWVGWWVIDEIEEAVKDGFDWKADPDNPRFKYSPTLKAIIRAMGPEFGGVEAQESRNGYILKDEYFNR